MNADGSDVQRLSSSNLVEMYPVSSPGGDKIAFARSATNDRRARSDIYLMPARGGSAELLVENGTFPTFDSTGEHIYFERDRQKVMRISLATKQIEEIFPAKVREFQNFEIAKPRLSGDGRFLYFISDRRGRWNVWGVEVGTRRVFWVGSGCEPTASFNGEQVFWIKKKSFFGKTGIATKNITTDEVYWLDDVGPERGFKYFPTLVKNDSVLLFCSGDGGESTHTGARYQLFAKDLISGSCYQLTSDGQTNRWPNYLTS